MILLELPGSIIVDIDSYFQMYEHNNYLFYECQKAKSPVAFRTKIITNVDYEIIAAKFDIVEIFLVFEHILNGGRHA